ncbi:hypothetical protein EYC80_003303 [Monilinia laxa]|uniref:Thioesterase domain-containing protein n=1 Tax=Monilinia laxa TaxID=61186 RepID=A0A5N6KDE8_MONLA|nr:hypothetical protein EYC80_003303 [Monilinia laxa]
MSRIEIPIHTFTSNLIYRGVYRGGGFKIGRLDRIGLDGELEGLVIFFGKGEEGDWELGGEEEEEEKKERKGKRRKEINMPSGKPFDAMSDVGLRRLKVLMSGWKEHWGEYVGWGHALLPSLSLSPDPTHHAPNITTFIYQPTKHHCNGMDTVHGGCISTIFDACTSVALMGRYSGEKWGGGGVSRGLSVTFIKGIVVRDEGPENDVLVECEVVGGVGKRNAVLRATMKRPNGEVLAICEHSKVNIPNSVQLPDPQTQGRKSKL